jgi:tetratricopeptide (TPR) repeat protein
MPTARALPTADARGENGRAATRTATAALDAAVAAFRAEVRKRPDDTDLRANLGLALYSQGKLDAAIAEFSELLRLRPDDAWTRNSLGITLRDQRKLNEAIAQHRKAIQLNPDYTAHGELAYTLELQGKLQEAFAEYRTANRLRPDYHRGHERLGNFLLSQGKREEAIAELRIAVRTDLICTASRNRLAWTLALSPNRPRADYDEAVVHARRAVELNPMDGGVVNTLALAEYRAGHWPESIAASERSMAVQNGAETLDWFFLAMAHWQQGDKDEARKWFDQAVARTKEKDPKNTDLRQFWMEAAELLRRPGPDAPGTGSPVAPAVEKSR